MKIYCTQISIFLSISANDHKWPRKKYQQSHCSIKWIQSNSVYALFIRMYFIYWKHEITHTISAIRQCNRDGLASIQKVKKAHNPQWNKNININFCLCFPVEMIQYIGRFDFPIKISVYQWLKRPVISVQIGNLLQIG